ncbi:MAG: ferrochelatase [Verrucomicrobia bacterium]|nr:ferrochelatase [Verrucomicrobiota bacterium]
MTQPKNQAVLLVNLGSPDSPDVRDVRKYLREFLMDGRVLDAPYPIRYCVVNFSILPKRSEQSAEAYRKIWGPEGSPLVAISRRVQRQLQQRVSVPVELAMRYQNPSIENAVRHLHSLDIEELLLVPLFPHYAMSSFETAVERVKEVVGNLAPQMEVRVTPPYCDAPDYIRALAASAEDYMRRGYDHLLFSFHGLPERHLRKSDPTACHCLKVKDCCSVPSAAHATCYRAQCLQTVRAFLEKTGVTNYSVAFQSRLGKEPWMTPYTDREIARLARTGIKNLLVICPAFVSDCLETLEEIGLRGREIFLEAGGRDFTLIPCLNDQPLWIGALENMVQQFIGSPKPVPVFSS